MTYYKEPSGGIDAEYELSALVSNGRRSDAEAMLELADKVIAGEIVWPVYTVCPAVGPVWGRMYLFESGRCFCFLRHGDPAKALWLFVMFGQWMKDDASQRVEAGRRLANSQTQ